MLCMGEYVTIGGKEIKREDIFRYLGIIFDRSLSRKDQISRDGDRDRDRNRVRDTEGAEGGARDRPHLIVAGTVDIRLITQACNL